MNGFNSRGTRVAMGVLVLACLTACGGGGGGGNNDAVPSSKTSNATVSGVASKGLMKNALVKVFQVGGDGRVGEQLGKTVRTDATGHYTVENIAANGVVLVEVTVDGSTLMVDEATGTEVMPTPGFKMRAATLLSDGGAHLVHVTPFSELAVATAVANNGALTADLVAAANQKIVSFASVDVLTTEPTFDAANKPTNPVAVTVAAVSHMAKNGDFTACQTKASVADKVTCTVGELAKGGAASSQEIATKLEAAKQKAKQGYAGAVPPVVTQPPQLATNAVKDAITEAKSLIRNVRANAEGAVADDMRERVRLIDAQFKANVSPIDETNQYLVLASAKAVAILVDPVRELKAFTSAEITVHMGVGHETTCTLFSDEQATTRAQDFAGLKAIRCITRQAWAYQSDTSSSSNSWSWTYTDYQHDVLVHRTGVANQYQVQTQLFGEDQSYGSTYVQDQYGGHYDYWKKDVVRTDLSTVMAAQAVVGKLPNGHVNTLALIGDMAPGVDRYGALEDKLTVDIALSSHAVTEVQTRLNVQGRMTAIKSGHPSATVALLPGSYVQARTQAAGDAFAGLQDDLTGASVHVELEGSVPEGAKATGTLDITDFVQTTERTGPRMAVFKGALYQSNGNVLFSGQATLRGPVDPVIAPNHVSTVYAGWDTTVVGRLPLPSRPDMEVNLTVSVPASATQSRYTFAGSYKQADDTVLFSGLLDEHKPSDETLTLSTPSGVTLTGAHGQDTFSIKKGQAVIGVFYRSSGKIIYADNSYEQF